MSKTLELLFVLLVIRVVGLRCPIGLIMASNSAVEDGELSRDSDRSSDMSDESSMADVQPRASVSALLSQTDKPVGDLSQNTTIPLRKRKRSKRSKRYDDINSRMSNLEGLLQKLVEKNEDKSDNSHSRQPQGQTQHSTLEPTGKKVRKLLNYSTDDDYNSADNVSIFACGQISPSHKDSGDENEVTNTFRDNNNNVDEKELSESAKKCLFDMFGDDAIVKKPEKKDGLMLDKAQVEVLENSYRCKNPNYLTSFSEENFDLFPIHAESEELLQVPSLDSLVECFLTKRYGIKASFSKGKQLFSQPAKMIEKIAYKGHQASRLGLIIQMYVQQSLGNLLQLLGEEDCDRDKATQMVKDIFAMSTKCLDQIGRSGAFHHIIRRSVCMTDTGLFEQPDKVEFTNLPLSGDGVFGSGLETLLKSKKEKRKQIDDLIPDVRKKRKFAGPPSEHNKRPAYEKPVVKSNAPQSSGWNNFRIPMLSRPSETKYDRTPKFRGGYGPKRGTSGRGRPLARADDK